MILNIEPKIVLKKGSLDILTSLKTKSRLSLIKVSVLLCDLEVSDIQ